MVGCCGKFLELSGPVGDANVGETSFQVEYGVVNVTKAIQWEPVR